MVIFCSHRRRSVVKCGSPVKPSNCFRHFKTLVLPYHPFLTQVFTLDDVKLSVIEHEFWMKEWLFRGSKRTDPSYIFQGSRPQPPWSTPVCSLLALTSYHYASHTMGAETYGGWRPPAQLVMWCKRFNTNLFTVQWIQCNGQKCLLEHWARQISNAWLCVSWPMFDYDTESAVEKPARVFCYDQCHKSQW